MPTNRNAVCRLCRREGVKLFLKGARCDGAKCTLNRRENPPGVHGYRRRRRSEYGVRLREKQRAKRYYGIRERQFRLYFAEAERQKGDTGENLFILLERRLDNVVYRAGLGLSRSHARQLIVHGHFAVNGRRTDRPSFRLAPNDVVALWSPEHSGDLMQSILEQTKDQSVPEWIEVQREPLQVRVRHLPSGEEATVGFQPHLIVELCSR